ncbi:MAG: HyaD/HybD family hydrogenase maturation endopeptidase [Chlorobiales bacterium]|nr:HyaD/HybD family hydrogenase maturation endopeptidase [Chlorobiales bacterium]
MKKINVIGLGNILFGDEGFGVEAVRLLEKECTDLPDSVQFIDGGTQGLNLLDYIESADIVLIFDAIIPPDFDRKVYVYADGELPGFIHRKMSSHQMGLSELLSVARLHGKAPEKIVLVGVPPRELELGSGISLEVQELLADAVGEGKKFLGSVVND